MNKACPVILRHNNNKLELLAFEHPNAGNQLVKGNIKMAEPLESACIRELAEESGIQGKVVKQLGIWEPDFKNQVWGFCLMHYDDVLPDTWNFQTQDDGGHVFSFFWQPLDKPLNENWKDVYRQAFHYIKNTLNT